MHCTKNSNYFKGQNTTSILKLLTYTFPQMAFSSMTIRLSRLSTALRTTNIDPESLTLGHNVRISCELIQEEWGVCNVQQHSKNNKITFYNKKARGLRCVQEKKAETDRIHHQQNVILQGLRAIQCSWCQTHTLPEIKYAIRQQELENHDVHVSAECQVYWNNPNWQERFTVLLPHFNFPVSSAFVLDHHCKQVPHQKFITFSF